MVFDPSILNSCCPPYIRLCPSLLQLWTCLPACRSSVGSCSRPRASRSRGSAMRGRVRPGGSAEKAGECSSQRQPVAAASFQSSRGAMFTLLNWGSASCLCPCSGSHRCAGPAIACPSCSFGCEEMSECPVPTPFIPLGDFITEVGRCVGGVGMDAGRRHSSCSVVLMA